MSFKKIALLGHAASGKTSCLQKLEVNLPGSDMSWTIGHLQRPQTSQLLNWLMPDMDSNYIVSICNRESILNEFAKRKMQNDWSIVFSNILFVYLCHPKVKLKEHLLMPTAEGYLRSPRLQRNVLKSYERFHERYLLLAHHVIDCDGVAQITDEIKRIYSLISDDTKRVYISKDGTQ